MIDCRIRQNPVREAVKIVILLGIFALCWCVRMRKFDITKMLNVSFLVIQNFFLRLIAKLGLFGSSRVEFAVIIAREHIKWSTI